MIKIRVHNGKWNDLDKINPLSSEDQYVQVGAEFDGGKLTILGIDTEMLIKKDSKTIWPWDMGYPQEREPKGIKTSGGSGLFDFHGDGYATELCSAPTHCLEVLLESLGRGLRWQATKASPNSIQSMEAVELSAPALYDIPEDIEKAAPEEAKRLGCMPSTNIYGDAGDPSSLNTNTRTTGCHLHISHPSLLDEDTCLALVKWADILVGCTWTYISPNPSKAEAQRRKAYGRAGEYRLKKYPVYPETEISKGYAAGVEYRVLPGTPMNHPAYLTLLFSLYRSALRLANVHGDPQPELSAQAQQAVNSADRAEAKAVIRTLPFTPNTRKLIRFMRRIPLKAKNLLEWYQLGSEQMGHAALYTVKGDKMRNLTL